MFYHLDGKEREEALAEIIRVMRPYGCFTSSTSGANNKPKTRMFERAVGPYLRDVLGIDTQEPVPMNTGFTTEKSLLEIPPRFTNAYVHNQRAAMYVNDKLLPGSLGTYLKAFDANRTLFDPVPPLDAWNAAREAVVEPFIEAEIKETGVFKDYAERSVIIASNGTLDSGRLEAHGFMNAK
jgi:SAM-dependent methyltransferase